jgi:hypothetical protein
LIAGGYEILQASIENTAGACKTQSSTWPINIPLVAAKLASLDDRKPSVPRGVNALDGSPAATIEDAVADA